MTELERRAPGGGLDRYESRYMATRGQVIAHQRFPPTWRYHATFALVAAIVAAKAQTLLIAASGLGVVGLAWLFFAALRVTLTATHVHVQYGLLGPRIPIERIRSADAIEYDWTRYRGGFIRHKLLSRETLFSMPGDRGRALRIRWNSRSGAEKTTVVSCPDPVGLATAIDSLLQARRDAVTQSPESNDGLRLDDQNDSRQCLPASGED